MKLEYFEKINSELLDHWNLVTPHEHYIGLKDYYNLDTTTLLEAFVTGSNR